MVQKKDKSGKSKGENVTDHTKKKKSVIYKSIAWLSMWMDGRSPANFRVTVRYT